MFCFVLGFVLFVCLFVVVVVVFSIGYTTAWANGGGQTLQKNRRKKQRKNMFALRLHRKKPFCSLGLFLVFDNRFVFIMFSKGLGHVFF